MERTVNQGYFQWIQRITCQHTILHGSSEALLYRRDKFLRNVTTLHFVDELQSAFLEVFINRADVHDNISELTTTTGLLLVNFTQVDCLSDSFLIVNLRLTLVTFNLELTFQTVDDNIQVKLTHTRDNCLTSLFVSLNCKRRIFFSQLSQDIWQFIHILLSLRLNCDTNYRFREVHRLQYNRCSFVTQCITSMYILETYASTNITSTDNFYRILLVWVHLEQTGYALLLPWTGIINIRTRFNFSWINTEESQTTDIRVSSNLKCQSRCFFIIIRLTIFLQTSIRISSYDIRSIQRRRQECTNIVKQSLYTFVLEWRSTQHRNNSHLYCCVTKSSQNLFFCNSRRIIEIFLHQGIVKLSYFFKHLISPFIGFVY